MHIFNIDYFYFIENFRGKKFSSTEKLPFFAAGVSSVIHPVSIASGFLNTELILTC